MKLTQYKNEVTTVKSFPGLFDCAFKHKIASAEASLNYKGPPMDRKMWDQILAFFQWTYDTTHSESQVRLFVNVEKALWAPWAFPQEARTGMTAKELDTEDFKKQRAMFKDSEGWIYFGTVHHHCSAGAFQSGTDLANEQGIDGLHITIGKMASDRYDMHCRFYVYGCMFEPDMGLFWDIGEEVSKLIPANLHDQVARFQMCEKVKANTDFPDQWKTNLIEVKSTFPGAYSSQGTSEFDYRPWQSQSYQGNGPTRGVAHEIPKWLRARKAAGELALDVLQNPYDRAAQAALCEFIRDLAFGNTPELKDYRAVLEVVAKWGVTIDEIWQDIPANNTLFQQIESYKFTENCGNGQFDSSPKKEKHKKKDKEEKAGAKEAKPEQKALQQTTVPESKMLEEGNPNWGSCMD